MKRKTSDPTRKREESQKPRLQEISLYIPILSLVSPPPHALLSLSLSHSQAKEQKRELFSFQAFTRRRFCFCRERWASTWNCWMLGSELLEDFILTAHILLACTTILPLTPMTTTTTTTITTAMTVEVSVTRRYRILHGYPVVELRPLRCWIPLI
ncbi:hypothetical protein P3X46_004490 [Hevea brasiliensis]|uniref:Uncharacterized protein n=1 Tax=Hevea brasiliensis TaxID=3981 RepID=A0ABQ9MWY2_HEVBR|nr:hypothetical protein P3X46_004490 [Hevea brasiliensis]